MSEPTTQAPRVDKKVEPPFSGPLAGFEAWLYETLYVKVPYKLPVNIREWIVKYGPWVTLVIGLLMLPGLLTIFTVGSYVSAVYSAYVGVSVGPMYYLAMLMLAVEVVLMFVSIPMLLKRQRNGWLLLFYSSTLSLVYSILNSFSYGFYLGALLSGLLWGAVAAGIGYYVLFQIRSYYKQ